MAKQDVDRISRETAGWALTEIISLLDLEVASSELLPSTLVGTFHNEVDFLAKVEDMQGQTFLIHIEFQTQSDPNMMARMNRYHGHLYFQYRMPIFHFVFYLGDRPHGMQTKLKDAEIFSGYHILSLKEQPFQDYLNSEDPRKIIFGILTDFGQHSQEEGIQLLLERLQKASSTKIEFRKHLKQLKILSKISNLGGTLDKIVKRMPIEVEVKTISWYQDGVEEGELNAILKLVSKGIISLQEAAKGLETTTHELQRRIKAFQDKN